MSFEEKIQEIEALYDDLEHRYINVKMGSKTDNINDLIKDTLRFQSSLELLLEDVRDFVDEKTKGYFNRLREICDYIRNGIRGYTVKTWDLFGIKTDSIYKAGIIEKMNSNIDKDRTDAYNNFTSLRIKMYQFFEDIKLIHSLKMYPIEEKLDIKSRLDDYGFSDVVKCLEEVDDNLIQPLTTHYKDALDRGREALEKMIVNILIKLDFKPSGSFSNDIGNLSGQLKFITRGQKGVIESVYSYLSVYGSHGEYGGITLGDAQYGIKEMYWQIDKLLNILDNYTKEK